jgi:Tol biopolymer transport system component
LLRIISKNFILYFFVTTTVFGCASSSGLPELQQSTPTQNLIHATISKTIDNSATIARVLIQDHMNYYLANPDGSEQVLLYSGEQSPLLMASLSPDATKFAYFMYNYVYVQNIATGKTATLNQEIIGSSGMGQIRWSPDGTKLALTCAKAQQPSFAICLIDTQTGQIEVLVNEKNTDEICSSNNLELRDWSQDGTTMVYTCGLVLGQGQKQDFSIYLYDLASKTSKRVFDGTTHNTIWEINSASISPDKNYLLITGVHQDYIQQVFLFDLSNNTLKQLTNEANYNSSALVWRSDSRTFYLHKTFIQIPYPGSNYVMDINGDSLYSIEISGSIIK